MFSIDPDAEDKWLNWHPAPLPEFIHEVDTSAQELMIDKKSFECKAGNCWVDLECLGRECYQLVRTIPCYLHVLYLIFVC